jgi:enolase
MSNLIVDLCARKVVDTRAEMSIEVDVIAEYSVGRASAPLGAPGSRGEFEPPAYPDGGVDAAIEIVDTLLTPRLAGEDVFEQARVDLLLLEIDGTKNYARIGGNTAMVVSLAVAKAAAHGLGIPLYRCLGTPFNNELSYPISNIIGGGPHARVGMVPDMQEHQMIPVSAETMSEAVWAVVEAWHRVGEICKERYPEFNGATDDESAWVPSITDWEALEILSEVAEELRTKSGVDMRLGLDVAAANFWDPKRELYVYHQEGVERTPKEQLAYISKIIDTFPMYYVEDFVHDDDYQSYVEMTERYGQKLLICGDDLFCTNTERLVKGLKMGAANSLIIKTNQTGTLTDAWRTVDMAKKNGYMPIKSCRSGETEDTAIAQLAVAWGCPANKFAVGGKGPTKLNELLRIEEELGTGVARMPDLPYL